MPRAVEPLRVVIRNPAPHSGLRVGIVQIRGLPDMLGFEGAVKPLKFAVTLRMGGRGERLLKLKQRDKFPKIF